MRSYARWLSRIAAMGNCNLRFRLRSSGANRSRGDDPFLKNREMQGIGRPCTRLRDFPPCCQESYLSSGGKAMTRSGLTTITTRSSAGPLSSGVLARPRYFCEAASINWKSGSPSIRTTLPLISSARYGLAGSVSAIETRGSRRRLRYFCRFFWNAKRRCVPSHRSQTALT